MLSIVLKCVAVLLGVLILLVGFRESTLRARSQAGEKQRVREEIQAAAKRADEAIAKQQPRHLTEQQRKRLEELFRDGPKGKVFVVPKTFDEEAETYAKELSRVIASAGFTLESLPPPRPFSFGRSGAFLWIRNSSNPPPHAVFIQTCFREVGIVLDGCGDNTKIDAESVMIAVGPKL